MRSLHQTAASHSGVCEHGSRLTGTPACSNMVAAFRAVTASQVWSLGKLLRCVPVVLRKCHHSDRTWTPVFCFQIVGWSQNNVSGTHHVRVPKSLAEGGSSIENCLNVVRNTPDTVRAEFFSFERVEGSETTGRNLTVEPESSRNSKTLLDTCRGCSSKPKAGGISQLLMYAIHRRL